MSLPSSPMSDCIPRNGQFAAALLDGLYAAIQSASQLRSRRNAARTRRRGATALAPFRSESIRNCANDLCTYDPDTDADIGAGTARSDATKWQRPARSSGSTQRRATASSPSRGGTMSSCTSRPFRVTDTELSTRDSASSSTSPPARRARKRRTSAPSEGLRVCALLNEADDVGQDTTLPDSLGDGTRSFGKHPGGDSRRTPLTLT